MSNRSGSPYSAPTDADRRPVLLGASTADGITPIALEVNSSDGGLLVHSTNGTGGDTQYAELSTTSPATGNAMLGRYLSSPSGGLSNNEMSMPLMDNYGQLKVVPVGTVSINTAQIAGNNIVSATTGVQMVGLSGGDGNSVHTTSNALNTYLTNSSLSVIGSTIGSSYPATNFPIGINNSSGNLGTILSAYGQADAAGDKAISSGGMLFNGTTWDRARSGGVIGMTGVSLQASPSGGWSYVNISTDATTVVKSGAGTFHLACVNTLGTVSSTTTFYDNTAGSGTVIAIINTLTLSGSFIYDIAFSTGLTVVTTGSVAPNITVAYK